MPLKFVLSQSYLSRGNERLYFERDKENFQLWRGS